MFPFVSATALPEVRFALCTSFCKEPTTEAVAHLSTDLWSTACKKGLYFQCLDAFPVSEAQDMATREFSYCILNSEGLNLREVRSQHTLYGSVTFETRRLWGAERNVSSERLFASHHHPDFTNTGDCYILSIVQLSLLLKFLICFQSLYLFVL